ncbi:MAG: hypothetical protein ABMB14_38790, partial [Myxococcota bacterium]
SEAVSPAVEPSASPVAPAPASSWSAPPPPDEAVPAPPPEPVAPAPFPWPTRPLPEASRLRGAFRSAAGGWAIFTVEGVFTDAPPPTASPVDWDRHRAAGHRVAVYVRSGEAVTMSEPGGAETAHTVVRDGANAVVIDGAPHGRADWDLGGRAFGGAWRSPDGAILTLSADGAARWSAPASPTRGAGIDRAGTYTLGVGAIAFGWADGAAETWPLLSDLKPSSRRPATVWLRGEQWQLVGG